MLQRAVIQDLKIDNNQLRRGKCSVAQRSRLHGSSRNLQSQTLYLVGVRTEGRPPGQRFVEPCFKGVVSTTNLVMGDLTVNP